MVNLLSIRYLSTSYWVEYPGIGTPQINIFKFGKWTTYLMKSFCLTGTGKSLQFNDNVIFSPAFLSPGAGRAINFIIKNIPWKHLSNGWSTLVYAVNKPTLYERSVHE